MLYAEFRGVVARSPDKVAITVGNRSLTYRALDARIRYVASVLHENGVREQEAVLLLVPNGIEFVTAVFAILSLRAVVVPVNTRFPPDEIRFYLDSSGARTVIHASDADVEAIPASVTRIGMGMHLAEEEVCASGHGLVAALTHRGAASRARCPDGACYREPASNSVAPEELAALYMYSSGSTGKPKRVMRTHAQLIGERQALAATIHLTESDRILCTVPLYHAHGFGNCLLAALLTGGTLVIVPGEFNPRETLRALDSESISIYPAVPFMFKMLTEIFLKTIPDLRHLRLAFSAGAAMPDYVGQRFQEIYGVPVRQLYGSTETGAISINYAGGAGTEASVGLALSGIRIDIVDESGTPVRHGEVGLVAVKSPAMTHQYDGLPEMTAECFVGGYFLPGDMGCKDEQGYLYIKGRKKLLINVAGNKVDPLDVEAVIGRHAKVSEVVVVGEADPIYGERVKAVVVANETCEASEIIQYCAAQLAEYKVPKLVEFRNDIPRSPLGKILRKYL